ncbi:hypothetical protein EJB05_27808, partial [Eragrostis curvula]
MKSSRRRCGSQKARRSPPPLDFTLYRPLTFHDSARPDHDLRHHRLAAEGNCAEEFLVSVDGNSRGQPDGVCQRDFIEVKIMTRRQFCIEVGSLLPCADSLKSSCVNLTSQDKDMEQTALANAWVFVTRGGVYVVTTAWINAYHHMSFNSFNKKTTLPHIFQASGDETVLRKHEGNMRLMMGD